MGDGTSAAHQPHATDAGVGQPGAVAYGRVGLALPPGLAYDQRQEPGDAWAGVRRVTAVTSTRARRRAILKAASTSRP